MRTVLVPQPVPHEAQRHALSSGTNLLQYRIKEVLQSDSGGYTYLAHNRQLQYDVVIREYLPEGLATRQANETDVVPESSSVAFERAMKQFRERSRQLGSVLPPVGIPVLHEFSAFNTAYRVSPYTEAGSLSQLNILFSDLNQEWIAALIFGTLQNLAEMHNGGIVHGAISARSILFQKNNTIILTGYADTAEGLTLQDDLTALGHTAYQLLLGRASSSEGAGMSPLSNIPQFKAAFSPQLLSTIDRAISGKQCWKTADDWMNAIAPLLWSEDIPNYDDRMSAPYSPVSVMGASSNVQASAAPPLTIMGGSIQQHAGTNPPSHKSSAPPLTIMGSFTPTQNNTNSAMPPLTIMGNNAPAAGNNGCRSAEPPATIMGNNAPAAGNNGRRSAEPPATIMGNNAPAAGNNGHRSVEQPITVTENRGKVDSPQSVNNTPSRDQQPQSTSNGSGSCMGIIAWALLVPAVIWASVSYIL